MNQAAVQWADKWPTSIPNGRPVRFVDASAGFGGDGSRASPFNRIADAFSPAVDNLVVALAKGRYPEPITPPAGALLLGACVAETVIAGAVSTLTVVDDAEVSNLSIKGDRVLMRTGTLRMSGVVVETSIGIHVERGDLLLDRSVVHSQEGPGIDVSYGHLHLQHAIVEDGSISLNRGSTATISDTVIRAATMPNVTWHGIGLLEGARAHVLRTTIERGDAGIIVMGSTSAITMESVVLRGLRQDAIRV